MYLFQFISKWKTHEYELLSGDVSSEIKSSDESQRYTSSERTFYNGTAVPWSICGILLIALATLAFQKAQVASSGNFGSYEGGFATDIGWLFLVF